MSTSRSELCQTATGGTGEELTDKKGSVYHGERMRFHHSCYRRVVWVDRSEVSFDVWSRTRYETIGWEIRANCTRADLGADSPQLGIEALDDCVRWGLDGEEFVDDATDETRSFPSTDQIVVCVCRHSSIEMNLLNCVYTKPEGQTCFIKRTRKRGHLQGRPLNNACNRSS